jgi:hypothetical protein
VRLDKDFAVINDKIKFTYFLSGTGGIVTVPKHLIDDMPPSDGGVSLDGESLRVRDMLFMIVDKSNVVTWDCVLVTRWWRIRKIQYKIHQLWRWFGVRVVATAKVWGLFDR